MNLIYLGKNTLDLREKAGKILANYIRQGEAAIIIPAIRSQSVDIVIAAVDMNSCRELSVVVPPLII